MKRLLTALLLLPLSACIIDASPNDSWTDEIYREAEAEVEVQVVALQHAVAHGLAGILAESLSHLDSFKVVPDARTNSLLLTGTEGELGKAKDLIATLDVPGQ